MAKREEKKETGEDVELEGAETLLSRLRRQYRMMERNRRQYRDEATVLLGRQRKIYRDLQREKSELEEQLAAMSTPQNETRDLRTVNNLAATLDRQREYQEAIDQEVDKARS
ncbi:uncharacterized protein LOC135092792 [Scylla paramamosain]|uniref:uncharacterized protein LOC135092792 n=1 Tax=Scylla paramamosain TaxID=85552 RepID=UPI003083E2F7